MKKIIHKADSRGHANHGWLNSYHMFSFANYYNPERMHFGLLRVLNDDTVAPGMGFGTHPHDNMEIISIPLSGALEHKDSMGTVSVIQKNEVQIMSAGTGVRHSEYNHSKTEEVKFLQIWIFPQKQNIVPRYEQKAFLPEGRKNKFQTVVSPTGNNGSITINQNAYFSLGDFDAHATAEYRIQSAENGAYIFVLEGSIEIETEKLEKRDGMGIWETGSFSLKALSNSEVLIIEVPMN